MELKWKIKFWLGEIRVHFKNKRLKKKYPDYEDRVDKKTYWYMERKSWSKIK